MRQQPDGSNGAPAGRGLDLFFGDAPEEAAAPEANATPEMVDAAIDNIKTRMADDQSNGTPREDSLDDAEFIAGESEAIVESAVEEAAGTADGLNGAEAVPIAGAVIIDETADDVAEAVEAVLDDAYEPEATTVVEVEAAETLEAATEGEEAEVVDEAIVATAAAATVGELPVVGIEIEPEPEPQTPPAQPAENGPPLIVETERKESFSAGCLRALLMIFVGALLGVVLALAVLYFVNGDLDWASPDEVAAVEDNVLALQHGQQALSGHLETVDTQVATLEGNVGVLNTEALPALQGLADDSQSRVTTLESTALTVQEDLGAVGSEVETLTGDLNALDENVGVLAFEVDDLSGGLDALSGDVDTLAGDVGVLAVDLDTLGAEVDQISISAQRIDVFLEGMRNLLSEVMQEKVAAGAVISPTEALTATEALTPTSELTATETITPAAAITETVPLTATEAITATEELTATGAVTASTALTTTDTITNTVDAEAAPEAESTAEEETPTSGIRGVVFVDSDNEGEGRNRQRDDDEVGIPGVTITLYSDGLAKLGNTITDEEGNYSFDDLPPGQYIIVQTDLPGFRSSTLNSITAMLRGGSFAEADFGDYELP